MRSLINLHEYVLVKRCLLNFANLFQVFEIVFISKSYIINNLLGWVLGKCTSKVNTEC